MRAQAVRSVSGSWLVALLLAGSAAWADPGEHALRVMGVSPSRTLPREAGTAIFVAFEHEHYILTALHVARNGGRLLVQVGPPGVSAPQFYYLENLVENEFRVDPAADVCAFRCTAEGFKLLTSEGAGKRPILLTPINPERTWQVVALGNPNHEVIFPNSKGEVPFVVENVPGTGTIQSVQPAGDVFKEGVREGGAATRLIFIRHGDEIKPGFSGGPVFHSSDGSRTFELIGMIEGGDWIAKNRAWAVTTADLIKAIGSGQVLHFPPDTWPEILLQASVEEPPPAPRRVPGFPEDLAEVILAGIDDETSTALDRIGTLPPGELPPSKKLLIDALKAKYLALAARPIRSLSDRYVYCVLMSTLAARGEDIPLPDARTREQCEEFRDNVQRGLERSAFQLDQERRSLENQRQLAERRLAEVGEKEREVAGLNSPKLFEAAMARKNKDLEAAATAYRDFLTVARNADLWARKKVAIGYFEIGDDYELIRQDPVQASRYRAAGRWLMLSLPKANQSLTDFDVDKYGDLTNWTPKVRVGDLIYSVERRDSGNVLELRCKKSSFSVWQLVRLQPDAATVLEWEWKAEEVPMWGKRIEPGQTGKNPNAVHPIQVLVGLYRTPDPVVIHYSWNGVSGEDAYWTETQVESLDAFPEGLLEMVDPGTRLLLELAGVIELRYDHIVVTSGDARKEWVPVRRRIADDFKRFHPKEKLPPIIAIAVQATDYEAPAPEDDAHAFIRRLRFVTDGPAPDAEKKK